MDQIYMNSGDIIKEKEVIAVIQQLEKLQIDPAKIQSSAGFEVMTFATQNAQGYGGLKIAFITTVKKQCIVTSLALQLQHKELLIQGMCTALCF